MHVPIEAEVVGEALLTDMGADEIVSMEAIACFTCPFLTVRLNASSKLPMLSKPCPCNAAFVCTIDSYLACCGHTLTSIARHSISEALPGRGR